MEALQDYQPAIAVSLELSRRAHQAKTYSISILLLARLHVHCLIKQRQVPPSVICYPMVSAKSLWRVLTLPARMARRSLPFDKNRGFRCSIWAVQFSKILAGARARRLQALRPINLIALPWKIMARSAAGMSISSMQRIVSRIYMGPFSGSNGASEANTTCSGP